MQQSSPRGSASPPRPSYTPLVPSPLGNPSYNLPIPPPPNKSPNRRQSLPPQTPCPKPKPKLSRGRPASQVSPTAILLRQKAAAAFRSESLIKNYSSSYHNNHVPLGSSGHSRYGQPRRYPGSNNLSGLNKNPFEGEKEWTTADTIDMLHSDTDEEEEEEEGDLGLAIKPKPRSRRLLERQDAEKQDDMDLTYINMSYLSDSETEGQGQGGEMEPMLLRRRSREEQRRQSLPLSEDEENEKIEERFWQETAESRRPSLAVTPRRIAVLVGILIGFVLAHGLWGTFGNGSDYGGGSGYGGGSIGGGGVVRRRSLP
ncbi:hypothetical protein QBC35DRAFT_148549 [Podospora australis]|uniref:Uncharacterized protein n=1 Tax=Podospora australis TaxID=1536484 RepID=A0AAN6WVQ0_9PEZI|nr:hypothetical protein QBC35DRAFT_148549 [Podospora australis]